MNNRYRHRTYSVAMTPEEVARKLAKVVARPGRFWLSSKYYREPWLEGRVFDHGFTLWVKRAGTYPPMPFAKARGKFVSTESGCTVHASIPAHKDPSRGLLAFLFPVSWIGLFATSVLTGLDFRGNVDLPWAPYLCSLFVLGALCTYYRVVSHTEARELDLQLKTILGRLGKGQSVAENL